MVRSVWRAVDMLTRTDYSIKECLILSSLVDTPSLQCWPSAWCAAEIQFNRALQTCKLILGDSLESERVPKQATCHGK